MKLANQEVLLDEALLRVLSHPELKKKFERRIRCGSQRSFSTLKFHFKVLTKIFRKLKPQESFFAPVSFPILFA